MIDQKYAETIFNFLYSEVNGYEVSNKARRNENLDENGFLYGELPFQTFVKIIESIKPKLGGTFIDLGSGTGRIVMQSYLMNHFDKVIGIEFLQGLHNKACEIKSIFDKTVQPQVAKFLQNKSIEFINGDILEYDYRDADFIFMNHPLKSENGGYKILEAKFKSELKKGTKIATIIRPIEEQSFQMIDKRSLEFSWGKSTAYFYEV